jgi:hypothetical protein
LGFFEKQHFRKHNFRHQISGSFKIFPGKQFISEKRITVQSFKLHYLQNSPLVPQDISASDCKGVGNISSVKTFSALRRILNDVSNFT